MYASIGPALTAFVAGMLSFFSPCVAPLVPGYISYLSGESLKVDDAPGALRSTSLPGRPAARVSLLFVAGFSVAFVFLGLAMGSFGRLFAAYQPVLETIAGIVMLAMGAFLLDLLPRQTVALLMRDVRWHLGGTRIRALGWLGPLLLGVVFALGWTPCIGPVLTSILVYVGAAGDRATGVMMLSFYSLGLGLPFLAVGFGWAEGLRIFGWLRSHQRAISLVSGAVLVIVGVLYITGQMTVIAIWAQHLTASRLH